MISRELYFVSGLLKADYFAAVDDINKLGVVSFSSQKTIGVGYVPGDN